MAPESPLRKQRSELATLASWAMFSRGLEPEFPAAALQQLAGLRRVIEDGDGAVRDLRALPWCSIDNDDSRDLDQLSACARLAQGGVRVAVAIADVDALVKKGTPIDAHARHNSTSVYTSARVFPMLPERLSTDLSSLNPEQDRLALVIEMEFGDDGALTAATLCRALVRNRAQLSYDAVSGWLVGQAALPEAARRAEGMALQLRTQDDLAQKLRARRHAQGALEFETFQPRALFDGERITDIRQQPHNRARQLIEELMIATNGCTARYLAAQGRPSLRRVVRSPQRWQRIVETARAHGGDLPEQPDGAALERFLAQQHRKDPLRFPDLSLVIVKLMGSGEYAVEDPQAPPIGHFGLAVQDYLHSTAPNRRFPDLITLRLVKAALAGAPPPYSGAELAELAAHCTQQEDAAKKVERQLRKSEAALLLHARIGEGFEGLVSGRNGQGWWVRIFKPPAEGRLIEPQRQDLQLGDTVNLRLVSTSVERGFIDFELSA